jgi:hypothetical protein
MASWKLTIDKSLFYINYIERVRQHMLNKRKIFFWGVEQEIRLIQVTLTTGDSFAKLRHDVY